MLPDRQELLDVEAAPRRSRPRSSTPQPLGRRAVPPPARLPRRPCRTPRSRRSCDPSLPIAVSAPATTPNPVTSPLSDVADRAGHHARRPLRVTQRCEVGSDVPRSGPSGTTLITIGRISSQYSAMRSGSVRVSLGPRLSRHRPLVRGRRTCRSSRVRGGRPRPRDVAAYRVRRRSASSSSRTR